MTDYPIKLLIIILNHYQPQPHRRQASALRRGAHAACLWVPTDERHQEDRCRSWRRTEDIDDALFIFKRIFVACRKELERGTADLQLRHHESDLV